MGDNERKRKLDDELALFESEISSLAEVEDPKPSEDAPSSLGQSSKDSGAGVPNQLRLPVPPRPPPVAPTAVIESAPTLYGREKNVESAPSTSSSANEPLKSLVLPGDVDLYQAKKQKEMALKNSYLGQVQRGEKKMKRFVRVAGGQVWEDASLAEWDPNDYRIFCGDLGNEVSDELLAKAFRKYPSFQKAKVVRDSRTNKSKGYGFVSFTNQDDFVRACREMDGKYVGNRPIKLRKSNWKERNMEVVKKKQKQKEKLGLL